MKTKFFLLLFLAGIIIPNLLSAQFAQQGPKLVGTGSVNGSAQGNSVAISSDGNTAIVGGPFDNGFKGAAWVFTRSGGVWTQQGIKLVGTGLVGSSQQGTSVAISSDGNTAIVGGYGDNANTGAVWIFTRSGGVWTQQGSKLIGTNAVGTAYQGFSVAISSDGNTALEGGYLDNNDAGAVWVFTRSGGVWTQQGQKLIGTGGVGNVYLGCSVAVSSDGNTLIAGGYGDFSGTGAVWIFTRNGSVWTQQGSKLVGTGLVGNGDQGFSVSISSNGNTAIEGGPFDNVSTGAVWVFTRTSGVWTQQGTKLIGTGAGGGARQGYSVAISSNGGTFLEGAPLDNGNGAVWVFVNPSIGIRTISTEIPENFSLSQNYPNPFNPSTKIRYDLPKNGFVKLVVFDELGREIEALVNEEQTAGTYEATFNATQYASGIYFYKLQTDNFSETKKMLLIK